MASLILFALLFVKIPFRTFKSIDFCFSETEALSFSIVLIYLHLLKVSIRFPDKFLNSWSRTLYLNKLSLFYTNAKSAVDFITKNKVWNIEFI